MASPDPSEPEASSQPLRVDDDVDPGPYTAHRLQHATPHHLHLTTRRCFIGPIPEGWLKSHRKEWYKRHLLSSNYSSRAATFSAKSDVSHRRQITGLDGPSASAAYGHSFPQPRDIDEVNEDEEPEEEAVIDNSPAVDVPRSMTMHEANSPPNPEPNSAEDDSITAPEQQRRSPKSKSKALPIAKRGKEYPGQGASSFLTARETISPESRLGKNATGKSPTEQSHRASSFVTAHEEISPKSTFAKPAAVEAQSNHPQSAPNSSARQSFGNERLDSTTSLIPHDQIRQGYSPSPETTGKHPLEESPINDTLPALDLPDGAPHQPDEPTNSDALGPSRTNPISSGLVRFNIPAEEIQREARIQAKSTQMTRRRSLKRRRSKSTSSGEIVKMEKMLVRIDSTLQELPSDYDENDSLKTESRVVEKWSEFVVVCRESTSEEADFSIQMYKSRVIPAVEQTKVEKRSKYEIPLIRKTTKVNLYSSLDKTVVIWLPWKMGTIIYILRTRSSASSVEWYTFLRNALGWKRSSSLQIQVPDLSLTLHLDNPFERLEASRDAAQAEEADDAALIRTMEAEKAVAGNIIQRCMKMLEDSAEWGDVLDSWLKNEKMGLAWKRYDRLEWVHGANEQKMYGTIAMEKSHELQLRPKEHYPTSINPKVGNPMEEPSPIEGFLIRLTSQRGQTQRLGKMFFKRLYFSTHNQLLCYCRPAKALPPPPPVLPMTGNGKVPSSSQIVQKTPLIYAINPYPLNQGHVTWLRDGNAMTRRKHDQDAYNEAERKINTMLAAEGYINLCQVTRVRNVQRGSSPADANVDEGPDVDFHAEVDDTGRDDGRTDQFQDDRTFELVLSNGLIIRLQAYNKAAKKEWMARLDKLVKYWKVRIADDMQTYKAIRRLNLERLNIDEEMESFLGQYARKWEVTRSEASPQLYNMCGISHCRAITMSGVLFRKPRRHSTFTRCGVILCHGHLLVFQGALRERTGKEMPHIHHERQNAIDLKECYIYSGLITEGDLLYQNQTFDSNHPGHHALPRIYLDDGWTSTDEDTMTCFVIWHSLKRSWFKANEEQEQGKTKQHFRNVSKLGVTGRAVVFKTRSRAERDHWVMSIGMEIERLQQAEEIRIVPQK